MTSVGQTDTQLTKAQVRAVESPLVPPLLLPHYVDPGSASSYPHSYHSLGHCLRTNIFPGAPFTWRSLTQDSYISHPLTAWPTDPHLWYGHKTDDMVQWTERNIMNQRLSKLAAPGTADFDLSTSAARSSSSYTSSAHFNTPLPLSLLLPVCKLMLTPY
ncbi:testis-expressed sequence 33 protein [Lates japonicus]|uniref:Testis-expressed sequence 33 protein n=1 Tax=Lates japonicus TaxID=270547 RepID=A0AAD3MVP3_LATJO|nr:testis-expressed sequence 33 protein [Lates japonicus]